MKIYKLNKTIINTSPHKGFYKCKIYLHLTVICYFLHFKTIWKWKTIALKYLYVVIYNEKVKKEKKGHGVHLIKFLNTYPLACPTKFTAESRAFSKTTTVSGNNKPIRV